MAGLRCGGVKHKMEQHYGMKFEDDMLWVQRDMAPKKETNGETATGHKDSVRSRDGAYAASTGGIELGGPCLHDKSVIDGDDKDFAGGGELVGVDVAWDVGIGA